MSVIGEFNRRIGYCIDYLEACSTEGAFACATRLLEARAIASDDLTAAALQVLALASESGPISALEFANEAEAVDFREVCDPALELARTIAGVRPDDDGA